VLSRSESFAFVKDWYLLLPSQSLQRPSSAPRQ
jgi:hypothetical protein